MTIAPLRFAGYAALFDIADGARDTIRRGAFARCLATATEKFPLLWQHRTERPIGLIEAIAEDARGLRVIGAISDRRSHAAAALSARATTGLSFGYRARHFRRADEGRELHAIELFEVSLVDHPLQPQARVHLIA